MRALAFGLIGLLIGFTFATGAIWAGNITAPWDEMLYLVFGYVGAALGILSVVEDDV